MGEERNIGKSQGPQIDFHKIIGAVRNFSDIQNALKKSIDEMKERGIQKIGFVSGPVAKNSEPDPELRRKSTMENSERMRKYAAQLREEQGFPVFASTDIFDIIWDDLEELKRVKEGTLSREEMSAMMKPLFQEVLRSGVTDIYMIPGWDQSEGAVDEFKTAQEIGINIHYLELNPGEQDRK
ncbi:MAG: DUF4406 domain-containing protein [Candidatus Roizmanbacteria bacterium]|nr:MAG: DUF4406 domain-containing protein [Candidatus Roizmanbacteria bacterium]